MVEEAAGLTRMGRFPIGSLLTKTVRSEKMIAGQTAGSESILDAKLMALLSTLQEIDLWKLQSKTVGFPSANFSTHLHRLGRSLELSNRLRMRSGGGRADSRIRTDDLIITNDLLYQLSYIGICTTILSLPSSLPRFPGVADDNDRQFYHRATLAPRKAG